jgi:hypothetical protein
MPVDQGMCCSIKSMAAFINDFSKVRTILQYSPSSLVTGGGRPEQQLAATGKVGAAQGVEGRRPLHGLPTGHGIRLRESF